MSQQDTVRVNLTWRPSRSRRPFSQQVRVHVYEPDDQFRQVVIPVTVQGGDSVPLVVRRNSDVEFYVITSFADGGFSKSRIRTFRVDATTLGQPSPATNLGIDLVNIDDGNEPTGVVVYGVTIEGPKKKSKKKPRK